MNELIAMYLIYQSKEICTKCTECTIMHSMSLRILNVPHCTPCTAMYHSILLHTQCSATYLMYHNVLKVPQCILLLCLALHHISEEQVFRHWNQAPVFRYKQLQDK